MVQTTSWYRLAVIVLLAMAAACGDDQIPIGPSLPPPTAVIETFEGTLTVMVPVMTCRSVAPLMVSGACAPLFHVKSATPKDNSTAFNVVVWNIGRKICHKRASRQTKCP